VPRVTRGVLRKKNRQSGWVMDRPRGPRGPGCGESGGGNDEGRPGDARGGRGVGDPGHGDLTGDRDTTQENEQQTMTPAVQGRHQALDIQLCVRLGVNVGDAANYTVYSERDRNSHSNTPTYTNHPRGRGRAWGRVRLARRASCARGSSSIRLPGIAVGGLRGGGAGNPVPSHTPQRCIPLLFEGGKHGTSPLHKTVGFFEPQRFAPLPLTKGFWFLSTFAKKNYTDCTNWSGGPSPIDRSQRTIEANGGKPGARTEGRGRALPGAEHPPPVCEHGCCSVCHRRRD